MSFKRIIVAVLILAFQNEATGEKGCGREAQSCDGTLLHSAVRRKDLSYLQSISMECELYAKDEQGLTPMHTAILGGDVEMIIALAEAQFDVNWIDGETTPVLHFSVMSGNKETTVLLLELGSVPNAVDTKGNTALYYALELHKRDIAELLVKHGADVNIKDETLNSNYHKFVLNKDLRAVMILSSLKVDPNGLNVNGETPLSLAIANDTPSMINFLIAHGANITHQPYLHQAISSGKIRSLRALLENGLPVDSLGDGSNMTPIELAIQRDDTNAMDILAFFGAKLTSNGESLLNKAVSSNSGKAIVWLLDRGVELQNDEDGNNPLHTAVKLQHLEAVKALLSRPGKIDINERNDKGDTTLMLATENCNSKDIVKELLEHGADAEVKGHDGCTPLLNAARHNCTEIISVLLDHRADNNRTCDNANTALIYAADKGNYDVVKALLSRGADVNARGTDNGTSLHRAAQLGYTKIAEELLRHGASATVSANNGDTPLNLFTNSANCNADIVKVLLEKGADVDKRGNWGCPPLLLAAHHNCTQVVNVLLDHRADVNSTCGNGNTALIIATYRGNYDVVKALLSRGADVNARGYDNETALHYAAYRGDTKITEELLRHGASVTLKNVHGSTPYKGARYYNKPQTAELIKNWLH